VGAAKGAGVGVFVGTERRASPAIRRMN